MTVIAQQLDRKLKKWGPATASQVEKLVSEIIALADQGSLTSPLKSRGRQKDDPFFADSSFYNGDVPKDSSVNHDKYLYGAEA